MCLLTNIIHWSSLSIIYKFIYIYNFLFFYPVATHYSLEELWTGWWRFRWTFHWLFFVCAHSHGVSYLDLCENQSKQTCSASVLGKINFFMAARDKKWSTVAWWIILSNVTWKAWTLCCKLKDRPNPGICPHCPQTPRCFPIFWNCL